MLQKESRLYKKLTKPQWRTLKMACPYQDMHHVFSKRSEQLCLIQPMNHEDHIHNHSKYFNLNQVPRKLKLANLKFWKHALEDYEYEDFRQRSLLWI